MKPYTLLALLVCLSCATAFSEDAGPIIEASWPLERTGGGLGTAGYSPTPKEEPFMQKITAKPLNLWGKTKLTRPENMSDADWKTLQEKQKEEDAKTISVDDFTLPSQEGQYIMWFGIVRSMLYDEKTKQTTLLLEHKYFDGLTDLHIQVVSLYGAGDFKVLVPKEVKLQPLSLVCVYGKVAKGTDGGAEVKPDYVRTWNWGLFTFMDYGKDKTHPAWVALRKIEKDRQVYSSRPNQRYYESLLGPLPAAKP